MLNRLSSIYARLPYRIKINAKYLPDFMVFGFGHQRFISEALYDVNKFQENLFRTLLYSKHYTEYGKDHIPHKIYPDEVFHIINELPTVESKDLANNLCYYKSSQANLLNSYMTTTGGTGRNPTPIILSNKSYSIEWGHILNIWSKAGYIRKKHMKLTLRGKHLRNNRLYRFNPIFNEVIADSFQINSNNFLRFYNEITKYNIDFIHGYPSLLKILMEYLEQFGLDLQLKGIFLGSEGSTTSFRQKLSRFFNCKVITWYGQSEKVVLAATFDCQDRYIIYSSYGYPNIINKDENGFGEIAGTTFINSAMPLINYRTGDYGKIEENNGKLYLSKVKGRWGKDFVYLDEKNKIPTTAINLHTKVQHKIVFYQIIQNDYGKLRINILPKKNYIHNSAKIREEVSSDLSCRLKNYEITYSIVNSESDIMRSKRGKMMMLVQNINQK